MLEQNRCAVVSLGCFFVLSAPASVRGQDAVDVPANPTCAECTIDLVPLVTLGGLQDPAGVGFSAQVAVSRTGRYAVSSPTFPGEIMIFDQAGGFERLVGEPGEGPGEFSSDVALSFDGADSLHVVTRRGSRYSVFSPSFRHVRSHALEGMAADFCLGPAGELFVAGPYLADGAVSHVTTYSSSGEAVQPMALVPMRDANPAEGYYVAACDADTYWGGAVATYLVTRWSTNGEGRVDLRARRDWFPPPRVAQAGSPPVAAASGAQLRARPRISGISTGPRGYVLVFLSVPDADLQGVAADPGEQLDTIVEAIDVASGELLVRQRFDQALVPIKGGGVFSIFEQDGGNLLIQVWELTLGVPD